MVQMMSPQLDRTLGMNTEIEIDFPNMVIMMVNFCYSTLTQNCSRYAT